MAEKNITAEAEGNVCLVKREWHGVPDGEEVEVGSLEFSNHAAAMVTRFRNQTDEQSREIFNNVGPKQKARDQRLRRL